MKNYLLNLSIFFQFWFAPFLFSKWNKKGVLATKLKLIVILSFSSVSLWAQPPNTFNADGFLLVPGGVTKMTVEAWGGGGAGGGASGATSVLGVVTARGGGGGGGGAFATAEITVVPGGTLSIIVARQVAGSIIGTGTTGETSTILGFENFIKAVGGQGGSANTIGGIAAGGVGGLASACSGIATNGGNGDFGNMALLALGLKSGAGGKAAGPSGGNGGASILGGLLSGSQQGNPGDIPGGGGSGAVDAVLGGPQIGGAGAAGQVVVRYICPTYSISGISTTAVCTSAGTSTITLTGSAASLPVGVYTVTYNLSNPPQNDLNIAMTVTAAGQGSFMLSGLTTVGSRNITITKLTSGACVSTISSNNVASIITSATTVGGTVGGGTVVCSGSASGTLSLTGNTGTVLNWESAVAPFTTWTPITNTTTSYISGPLTETTRFRAVVQNGGCAIENAAATTVTVTPRPVPTFSAQPAATVCVNTDVTYTTQSGQVNYIWTIPGIAGTDYTIISGGVAATDSSVTLHWISEGNKTVTVSYSANGCAAVINASNTTSVTKTERGVVNGGLHVCSGSPSPLLTLNSYNGTIVRWEYAEAIPYVWQPINHTANTYQPGILTTSTSYRAVVKNGTCPEEFAIETRIDVDPKPLIPTLGTIVQPTCINPTGSIELNGLLATNWTITQNGTFPRLYSASGTNFTISNLAPGTYSFTIHENSSCPSPPTVTIQIDAPVTNIWNGGSWSKGSPPMDTDAIEFSGNYQTTGDLIGCSCVVNAGVNVTVNSNHTLYITNFVHNEGTFTFEDSASLIQTNPASNINSGNINYIRTTLPIRQADYVYWSTPVSPQTLVGVSQDLTLGDKYYMYGGTGVSWIGVLKTTVMVIGKGYIIRGPQNYSNTEGVPYTATFSGVPNNGTITTNEVFAAGKSFLLGNPYPSALDADKLILGNPALKGTLYFWTHNTPVVLVGAYKYNANDYASYNLSGGTGTGIKALTGDPLNPETNSNVPSGKIGAGQAFMAPFVSSEQITYTNEMRVGGIENSQFFKPGKAPKATGLEKHRIWLNFTNTEGAFKQLLIGYIEGATNNYESRYDGLSFDGNKYVDFYSRDNTNKFAIQGRSLPFTVNDTVPLGYRTTIEGDFTISIDQTDGNLVNQAIYLEDKVTNSIHDLKAADYTFTTAIGTFDDRFVLHYTNKSLGIIDFEDTKQDVLVSVKDKIMKVTSSKENISEVTIFDVTGKRLYYKNKVNATELQINNLKLSNQVLLVKTTLENGYTLSSKTMF